jgi:hypothetical protein
MIETLAPQRLTDGAGGCSSCVVDQRDTPVLTAAEAAAEPKPAASPDHSRGH